MGWVDGVGVQHQVCVVWLVGSMVFVGGGFGVLGGFEFLGGVWGGFFVWVWGGGGGGCGSWRVFLYSTTRVSDFSNRFPNLSRNRLLTLSSCCWDKDNSKFLAEKGGGTSELVQDQKILDLGRGEKGLSKIDTSGDLKQKKELQ